MEVLTAAGVDPTDEDFWGGGFAVVAGIVDELEGI